MEFNLALIPNAAFSKELEFLSAEFARAFPSKYILGKTSVPHCSVLQFSTDKSAEAVWQIVSESNYKKLTVRPVTFYKSISEKNRTWYGVEVRVSNDLKDLQSELVRSLGLDQNSIHNKLGDLFYPHFTIGMVLGVGEEYSFRRKILGIEPSCELRLCQSGQYHAAEKILF